MDVGEEGVGGPPSNFLDGVPVVAMKLECHGTSGSEGMAADLGDGEALVEEAKSSYRIFDSLVDVRAPDVFPNAVGAVR